MRLTKAQVPAHLRSISPYREAIANDERTKSAELQVAIDLTDIALEARRRAGTNLYGNTNPNESVEDIARPLHTLLEHIVRDGKAQEALALATRARNVCRGHFPGVAGGFDQVVRRLSHSTRGDVPDTEV